MINSTVLSNIPFIYPNELEKLPKLYEQEFMGENAIVHVKLFTPDSSFTWYITEFDGKDLCFGLVTMGTERELGYFTLSEIATLRGAYGLPVERDIYFTPTPIKEIK